ncbi:MAG: 50S ribosomal protein L6 [Neisseriaceae bacterium]
MSRIAKNPISIPADVEVKLVDGKVTVKGKLGELEHSFDSNLVELLIESNEIKFNARVPLAKADALSGTLRALVANFIQGVSKGFEKKLRLVGVGYRAQTQGDILNLSLGFSHPITYRLPAGITAQTPSPTEIIISGVDKQRVGQVAAEIRDYRFPEPYKGKGVRYFDEQIVIKETAKKK